MLGEHWSWSDVTCLGHGKQTHNLPYGNDRGEVFSNSIVSISRCENALFPGVQRRSFSERR